MSLKKIFGVLALIGMLTLCGTAAFAEGLEMQETYENRPVDKITGEVITENVSAPVTRTPGSFAYVSSTKEYQYTVDDYGNTVSLSVPNGIITQDSVRIGGTSEALQLYRNGEIVSQEDWDNLTEIGEYVLNHTSGSVTARVVSFNIVGNYLGLMNRYDLPDGFVVTELSLNGEGRPTGGTSVSFQHEGIYRLEYTNPATAQTFRLNVTVDHTAPEMTFTGLNENFVAHGPVKAFANEEGCTAYVTRNNSVYTYRDEFTEAGNYTILLKDRAGNSNSYAFTIRLYLNVSAGSFIAALVLSITAFIVYLIYYRRHLRVR